MINPVLYKRLKIKQNIHMMYLICSNVLVKQPSSRQYFIDCYYIQNNNFENKNENLIAPFNAIKFQFYSWLTSLLEFKNFIKKICFNH